MINIGLTGWGDHDSLYGTRTASRNKLVEYASYFPIVELDASFYAIQPIKNVEKWVADTPAGFQFIVKAYQGMTGHQRGESSFATIEDMFSLFKASLEPYQKANKLGMVLFQFPPWFDCTKANVLYLRKCKEIMGDIPCALEFRHQSWFEAKFRDKTLTFMQKEKWIHSICDEPQAGKGSIPIVLEPSNKNNVLIRFHGRNFHGWQQKNNPNWREVRYLYRYNQKELEDWADRINYLHTVCSNINILFNNNSGGDAADNAKHLIDLLKIEYSNLASRQLDLF
ncbi:DUF72 domain-containing protein [Niallia sp. 03133]|uniref:DUF72 domain-containing protein n=1 Tax=Niallia sp. 03133 TaxID=3458060 RepID=UPI0040451897